MTSFITLRKSLHVYGLVWVRLARVIEDYIIGKSDLRSQLSTGAANNVHGQA